MWGPEIHYVDNKYIVYFAGLYNATGKLSIGAAISQTDSPLGPYKDLGGPLIQNNTFPGIGVIGIHHFYDTDGIPYLLWKVDGNSNHQPATIMMRKVNSDGISFNASEPVVQLLKNTHLWEHGVVEGPWLIFRNGWYYLFHSGDVYCTPGYQVNVARSRNISGPYEKHKGTILHTDFNAFAKGENTTFIAPGHCSVIQVSDQFIKT